MPEIRPNSKQENLGSEKFAEGVANIIVRSYDFSQGSAPSQASILNLFSYFVKDWIVPDEELKWEIFQNVKKFIDGSGGVDAITIKPSKQINKGAHLAGVNSENLNRVLDYISNLSPLQEGRSPLDKQIEYFIHILLKRDLGYLFGVEKSGNYVKIVGRPGTSRTTDPEEYDNPERDKFFSYVIFYLLKRNNVQKFNDPVFDQALEAVRSSAYFNLLVEGKVGGSVQSYFDALVQRYNDTHDKSPGMQVDLKRPLVPDIHLLQNLGNYDYFMKGI